MKKQKNYRFLIDQNNHRIHVQYRTSNEWETQGSYFIKDGKVSIEILSDIAKFQNWGWTAHFPVVDYTNLPSWDE